MTNVVAVENNSVFEPSDSDPICLLIQRFGNMGEFQALLAKNDVESSNILGFKVKDTALVRCLKCRELALVVDSISDYPVINLDGDPICPEVLAERAEARIRMKHRSLESGE